MKISLSLRFLMLLCALWLTACVYKIDIAQGNLVTQEQVDQLKIGMTQEQVQFLMGTPMLEDPFHQSRWDYMYSLTRGHDEPIKEHVIVYFDQDGLVEEVERPETLLPNPSTH